MRVLIAGETAETAHGLAFLLGQCGYDPLVVHDGQAALAVLCGPDAPTLAVVEERMPGLSARKFCRELSNHPARLRTYVILLTAQKGHEQTLLLIESGADDCLGVPVDADELRACMHTGECLQALAEQLLATEQLLHSQVARDALIERRNRTLILEILDHELARHRRRWPLLSVILVDVDPFQCAHDPYGRRAGDEVLRQTAQRLRAGLRPGDNVGRYGDKKFLLLLPDCSAGQALWLAERLRQDAAREPVLHDGKPISFTLSLGVAGWDAEQPASELLRTVEGALDYARGAGGNRAVYIEGIPTMVNDAGPMPD
jgi:diguanylate cyclase (GGDEF)-like protein